MADINNAELEFDALEKCYKALSKLDDESKTRVIRYLLDKFKLINNGGDVLTRTVVSQPELIDKSDTEPIHVSGSVEENLIPSVFELVTKQYAKSEIDILLLVLYKMSKGNQDPINRSEVVGAYRDNNVYSDTRRKNVSANISALIRKSYITAPNNSSYALTPAGIEQVKLIAEGRSTTVSKKKIRSKTKK